MTAHTYRSSKPTEGLGFGASATPTAAFVSDQAPTGLAPDGLQSTSEWTGPLPCDCGDEFPMYGVAPHDCYWRKGPEFTIGQSTLLPMAEWVDLFVPDLEEGEGWEDFKYPSACGVFYCPKCQHHRYARAWSALCARIGPPPATVQS